ncbi:MAG: hypothetical protein AVDCRST_MAG93-5905 [uncultured Chloroflexia bacterium]|uniref:Uncharacterized protein n=1 Tax=uncultured Chloroflexia bacterium TaxID=1672391 RepID=A0A6J4L6T8_9CHLR|nr:MAG: hypothetical protein AVDCRST_MAG93-5905 [uncultured Chloroflexia bacterium]
MTRNKLTLLAASFAVATGFFWATILTVPPVTQAAPIQSLDIDAMHHAAPGDLPVFEDFYQMHTGVLDVLMTD